MFFLLFFTFQVILNNFQKMVEKKFKNVFGFKLPETDKNDFLKEYPVILILIPEVWTEELKLFALHISYSTKLWFLGDFLARIRIRNIDLCTYLFLIVNLMSGLRFVWATCCQVGDRLGPSGAQGWSTARSGYRPTSTTPWRGIYAQSSEVFVRKWGGFCVRRIVRRMKGYLFVFVWSVESCL